MWILLSLISAVLAGVTATLSKVGMQKVDSSLGFAVQSVVILVFTWGYVIVTGKARELSSIEGKAWIYLALTGLISALAYLFYFGAIKSGDVSRAAPLDRLSLVFAIALAAIFLGEKLNTPTIVGGALMALGALIITVFGGGGK